MRKFVLRGNSYYVTPRLSRSVHARSGYANRVSREENEVAVHVPPPSPPPTATSLPERMISVFFCFFYLFVSLVIIRRTLVFFPSHRKHRLNNTRGALNTSPVRTHSVTIDEDFLPVARGNVLQQLFSRTVITLRRRRWMGCAREYSFHSLYDV